MTVRLRPCMKSRTPLHPPPHLPQPSPSPKRPFFNSQPPVQAWPPSSHGTPRCLSEPVASTRDHRIYDMHQLPLGLPATTAHTCKSTDMRRNPSSRRPAAAAAASRSRPPEQAATISHHRGREAVKGAFVRLTSAPIRSLPVGLRVVFCTSKCEFLISLTRSPQKIGNPFRSG